MTRPTCSYPINIFSISAISSRQYFEVLHEFEHIDI